MKLQGKDESGNQIEVEVTPSGSMGLLAMGYRGIIIWRQARMAAGKPNLCDPEVKLVIENPIKRKTKNENE